MSTKVIHSDLTRVKNLTEEVFARSKKAQFPLVKKVKGVNCSILTSGYRKIKMDYTYCKTCDKDHRFPICKACALECHKGHVIVDYISGTDDNLISCQCGFKNHNMAKKEKEKETEENNIKCVFNTLSVLADVNEYYIGKDNKCVCIFCYHFCCHNFNIDDDEKREEELKSYNFQRVRVMKDEFDLGIMEGEIKCDCLSLEYSKHKSPDQLLNFLRKINLPYYDAKDNDNYFLNLSPVNILNLFFSSTELFEKIYSGFISDYNDYMKNLKEKESSKSISNLLNIGYEIFSNNAANCKYNFYFNEKINCFYTTKLLKTLLEKNFSPGTQMKTFYINYIKGYIKYRFGSYYECVPKYLISDFINLSPLQRKLYGDRCYSIYVTSGLYRENLLETVFLTLKNIMQYRHDIEENLDVIIELLRIIKYFARHFLIPMQDIIRICKITDELFMLYAYINDIRTPRDTDHINLKEGKVRLMKNLVKSFTFFTLYINDLTFFHFISGGVENSEVNYFQSFNEVNKLISKNMLNCSDFVRHEYEVARDLIDKEKPKTYSPNNNEYTNQFYKLKMVKIIFTNEVNIDFSLNEEDGYLYSLKRSINGNLPEFVSLINSKTPPNSLLKIVHEDLRTLENLYMDFFNSPGSKVNIIEDFISSIISKCSISNIVDENEFFSSEDIYECRIEYDYRMGFFEVYDGRNNTETSQDNVTITNSSNAIKIKIHNAMTLFNKSNLLYSLTKLFRISKDKTLFKPETCKKIIHFSFNYIFDNPDNCILGLTSPILFNLSKIPREFVCVILDYIVLGLKILIKNKCEIPYGNIYAKYAFILYHKTTKSSKGNDGINLKNFPFALNKIFQVIKYIYIIKPNDLSHFIMFIRPKLKEILSLDIIQSYKKYLLAIADNFQTNPEFYISKRDFNNDEIFSDVMKDTLEQTKSLTTQDMLKLFLRMMKNVVKTFDGDALEELPKFLKDFLSPEEIMKILSISSLHVSLRLEFIKYFRMLYMDLIIKSEKIDKYRYCFQRELDLEIAEMDSLIPLEQMRIFVFLLHLTKIADYDISSPSSENELNVIINELSNIKENISSSPKLTSKKYSQYIENGIILPLKIYLNKLLSAVLDARGTPLLYLYKICYYLLKMKEYVIESKLIVDLKRRRGAVINQLFYVDSKLLKEVKDDIATITDQTKFSVLNYFEVYKIIKKHLMGLVQNPTSKEAVLYFSDKTKYDQNSKVSFLERLRLNSIDISSNDIYRYAWNAYEAYIKQKKNFDRSSIKSNLDENFLDGRCSYRGILIKYLFFLGTNRLGSFSSEGLKMLLMVLKNDTIEAQNAILGLSDKKNKIQTVRQIEDFNYIAKQGFNCILSSIFSQYNPSSMELSDEYYYACLTMRFFKYICEEHNQFFQKRLMRQLEFDIGEEEKINFYEMMLFVSDKLITISSWESNNKSNSEVHDYYYGIFKCIIEMLIQIIQGSEKENFEHLYNDEMKINMNTNKGPFHRGKALKVFLKNIREIIFNDFNETDTILSVRSDLMMLLVAFMEELNCPRNIKNLIMSCFPPSSIIKSISTILKKYYLAILDNPQQTYQEKGQTEDNFKKTHINQLVDQNLDFKIEEENVNIMKPKNNKKLKQLRFNDTLSKKFTQLYFEENFSQTKTFQVCNIFYHYFDLTYIQYKNEETVDYWNKVHNQTDESLEAYNKRTKITNEMTSSNSSISNDVDLEAFYVIQFFKNVSKHILVQIKPNEPPVYVLYTIHPFCRYLSNDSKEEFLRTVDRNNRYTKLYDLINVSEYFMLEIIYNHKNFRHSHLLVKSTEVNYHVLGYVVFCVAFGLNFLMLCLLHESGESFYGVKTLQFIRLVSGIFSFFVILIVIFWFMTKLKLYFIIEKAKYKERNKNSKYLDESKITFIENAKITTKAIFSKGEMTPFFIYIIATIIGISTIDMIFFYSFSILSLLFLSKTLNTIARCIFLRGHLLLWTLVLTIMLLYVYSGWGFYYQRDRFYETKDRELPDEMCSSLLYCFLTHINNGLRWHAGIGKIVRSESAIKHPFNFLHRFIYDLLFFWLMEAVILKIFFGIILNAYGELRDAHYIIEKDKLNNCFICNIERDECEKNNESFAEHCDKVHNLWDYAFYLITLRMTDNRVLNSINFRNKEMIMRKQLAWFPEYRPLEDEEDE